MERGVNQKLIYEFGKFILDPQEKTLFVDGAALHLPAKEFETLLLLVENNGRALSKDEMIAVIWRDAFVEESNLAKQISSLRKIFDSNGERFIETLPKHGYRFSAEINRIVQPIEETILEKHTIKRLTVRVKEDLDDAPLALPPAGRKISTRAMLAICGLGVLAIATGFWYWSKLSIPTKINSIAVLPLKSLTAEENNKALGLGLADALITKIGSLRVISVRPTSAVVKFAETDADALEIGKKLNVDAVLEGTIQQSEGRLRINARLLKTSNGEQIWAENFDQPASEIFALQDALSNKIAKTLAFELNKSQFAELASRPTENAEAFEKYLRGRFYQSQNNEQGLTRSIEFYEQAIALDAGFAEPYAGIADAYLILYNFSLRPTDEMIPKVKQNLSRAMQLNPNLSQAYLTAAQLAFLYEHDGEKAGKFYQKSVELNPNNADAFLRYGYFLTSLGRFDEALVQLEKSRELNPISSIVQANIGLVYLSRRDYPAAIEQLNKTIAENPEVSIPHWLLGASYEGKGEAKKGLAENLLALKLEGEPELAARLETINQTGGEQTAYQAWFDEMLKVRKNGFVPAIQIGFLAAVLRNRTATLDWLEKAEQEHDAILWQIKYVARYDFVRDDERFKRLIEKMDLQPK
jgi:TolB-like protein/DNA-binding winged helix-turn-helix (wHTH) protein/Tfp pilus assembly protein PilF